MKEEILPEVLTNEDEVRVTVRNNLSTFCLRVMLLSLLSQSVKVVEVKEITVMKPSKSDGSDL